MKLIPILAVFLSAIPILGSYFRCTGISAEFFMAESGVFLRYAFEYPSHEQFINAFVKSPYNGHFTPIFFVSELIQSRWFSTSEAFWFWRQITVVSVLFSLIVQLNREFLKRYYQPVECWSLSISIAVVYLMQPRMLEMVAWPFMAGQLLCIAAAVAALIFLLKFLTQCRLPYMYCALSLGYMSMHFFGMGLAVSFATIASVIVILLIQRKSLRGELRWASSVVLLASLCTIFHGIMMVKPTGPAHAVHDLGAWGLVVRFGWFFIETLYASGRSLWGHGGLPFPENRAQASDAIYGLTMLIMSLAAIALVVFKKLRDKGNDREVSLLLVLIYLMVFLVCYSAFVVIRSREFENISSMSAYLIGSRYIVFPSFAFVIVACFLIFAGFAGTLARSAVLLSCLFIGGAVTANFIFSTTSKSEIWPWLTVRHDVEWGKIVESSKAAIAAKEPVQDISLRTIAPEFGARLSDHRKLLQRSLGSDEPIYFKKD